MSEAAIYAALSKALPKVGGAKKDSSNPHFKSKYADLGSVIDAIRPIADDGLWFRQVPLEHEGGACIETLYVHSSGELSAGKTVVPVNKNDAQGFGSALTYARRYGLMAAFGIAPEDDDGNAAAKSPPPAREPIQKRQVLEGPYTSKTALWNAVKRFDHDLTACSDEDMLYGLLNEPDTQALLVQVQRDAPDLWHGSPNLPEEFDPLNDKINRLKRELKSPANPLSAG